MPEHTEEPWEVTRQMLVAGEATHIEQFLILSPTGRGPGRSRVLAVLDGLNAKANARRIVACVNACRGIPTKALEDGEAVVSRKVCSHAQLETHVEASGRAFTFLTHIDAVTTHDCEVCRLLAAKEEDDVNPPA